MLQRLFSQIRSHFQVLGLGCGRIWGPTITHPPQTSASISFPHFRDRVYCLELSPSISVHVHASTDILGTGVCVCMCRRVRYMYTYDRSEDFINWLACVCQILSVMSDSLQPYGLYLPGSSVHGILQARILEWVAISYSR